MSRRISTKLRKVLLNPLAKSFILVRMGPFFDGSYLRQTTDSTDTDYDNELYSCECTLLSLDTPMITGGIDKGAYNTQFIDKDYWFRAKFIHGSSGVKAELRAVFIDVEGDYNKDQPMIEPEDTLIIYKGTVNGYSYSLSKDSLPIASIELASPLGSLSLVRSIITTQNWMRQKYPDDTSYDSIFEGSKSKTLGWGKR